MARKSNLLMNHDRLEKSLRRHQEFMRKILAAKRVIGTRQEKADLAEFALLRLCATWEQFIEEELIACVNRDASQLLVFLGVSIPKHPSKQLCQALLFGDRHRRLVRFSDLRGFSKKVLPTGENPFSSVSTKHRRLIDEAFTLRNYLSHYSVPARRKLKVMYDNNYGIERFVKPGSFLSSDNGSRVNAYFSAFLGASEDMRQWHENPHRVAKPKPGTRKTRAGAARRRTPVRARRARRGKPTRRTA